MNILWSIIIGAVCGALASKVMSSKKGGFLYYLIAGIVGGALGSWVAGLLGISIGSGLIGSLIVGVAGTCLLIFLCRLIFKN